MRGYLGRPYSIWPNPWVFVVLAAAIALSLAWSGSALAAGDANQSACPFETEASPGFRSYLPDCRAYELVTPPYEGGEAPTTPLYAPPAISANGEHLIGYNFTGPSTENDEQNGLEYGAVYELSRTSSGWSTESLEPPASLFARRTFETASADFSRSLWQLVLESSQGEEVSSDADDSYTFAIREPERADGSCPPGAVVVPHACFADVGLPVSPQHELESGSSPGYSVAGASRELTHILFNVNSERKQLWPGDDTRAGDRSLYEYVGTGNREPALVGVKNAGALEGGSHLNEDAELESDCGTILGSAAGPDEADDASAYNAISADGEIVYFTALHGSCATPEVNELYARVDGAKTVDVSEPAPEDCGECLESSKANAVFQGASEAGSKVFFTTAQELLHGQKGENLYEYDFDAEQGHRITLVSAGASEPQVQGVARISEDGSHVYYEAKGALPTTPNGSGESPENGGYNLYVYNTETKSTSFVATLLTVAEEQAIKGKVEAGEAGSHAEIKSLQGGIERTKASINKITAKIGALETAIDEQTAAIGAKSDEIGTKEAAIAGKGTEVKAVEKETEATQEEIENIEIVEAADQCSSTPSSVEECEELEEARGELEEAKEGDEEARGELEEAKEGDEEARGELEEAKEGDEEARGELEEARGEEEGELFLEEAELAQYEDELANVVAEEVTGGVRLKTGVTARDEHRPFETTHDGRFLVFLGARDLSGAEDTSTVSQVFEYDTQTQGIVRVSAGQKGSYTCPSTGRVEAGYNCDGNTADAADTPRILSPDYYDSMNPTEPASALSLAEDGAVVFMSANALTPGAIPGRQIAEMPFYVENIYEYREGNLYLISPANEANPPATEQLRLLGADASGNDVFFFTADPLVPQDTGTQASWYDARIGGGFTAPVSLPGCVGGACQGPLSSTPSLSVAGGSATQGAGENLSPVGPPKVAVTPKSKPLTRAQKLAKALKACKKRPKKRRAACETQARRHYGAKTKKKPKAKKSDEGAQ